MLLVGCSGDVDGLGLWSTHQASTPFIATHQPGIVQWLIAMVVIAIEHVADGVELRLSMADEQRLDRVSKRFRARLGH